MLSAAAVLYAVIAATSAAPGLGLLPWLGVVVFGAVAIYSPFEARRRRRSISAVRTEFDRRAARGTEHPPDDVS